MVWEANTKGKWWNNWGHMQAGRSIAKFRNLVSELCRSLGTKGMSWCEANLSVEVLLTLHWYTAVWTKIELVCSDQIQKVKSDSDDAPCDDFFYLPPADPVLPLQVKLWTATLPCSRLLSASERAGAMCFDGDSTFGLFRKTAEPPHYCITARRAVRGRLLGGDSKSERSFGLILCSSLSRSFFEIWKEPLCFLIGGGFSLEEK